MTSCAATSKGRSGRLQAFALETDLLVIRALHIRSAREKLPYRNKQQAGRSDQHEGASGRRAGYGREPWVRELLHMIRKCRSASLAEYAFIVRSRKWRGDRF